MRTVNLKSLIVLAKAQKHPLSVAVQESIEAGFVVPSVLKKKVQALGLDIVINPGRQFQHVVQVDVMDLRDKANPQLVASGTSSDEGDALLHAALGFVREQRIADLVQGGMPEGEAIAKAVAPQ